jgi:carboxypeptidase T
LAAWVVLAGLLAGLAAAQEPDNTPVVARLTLGDAGEVRRFIALGLDMLETREGDDYFILTTRTQLEQLRRDGWAIQLDAPQSAALHPSQPATFMDGYRTVTEGRAFLDDAAAQYPGLAQVFTYGLSYEGRELFGIRLSNRQSTGAKPVFFLMAAIHARELSTSELALRYVAYLLGHYGTDGDATWMLDDQQVVVVPYANPDGRELAQQGFYQRKNTDPIGGGACANPPDISNQSGVDLNRNSDYQWGVINGPATDPCAQTYPGPSAVSEPETAALENLVRSLFPDQRGPAATDAAPITTTGILLTLHSYGNLVLNPWGWTNNASPNDGDLALIGSQFASFNGYASGRPGFLLYNASGTTDDWSYGELGIASYTFELGPAGSPDGCGGFFPVHTCLDSFASGSFWPRNLPAFLHAARLARAPYQLARGPSPDSLTATVGLTGQAALRASLSEQYSGGQAIAAAEYYVDTPPWRGGSGLPMTAVDGAFDSPTESASALGSFPAGRHLLFVRGRDGDGNWGPVRAAWAFVPSSHVWLPAVAR